MGSGVLQLIKLSLFYLGLCCFLEESPMARPEIHGGRGCLAMTAGRYRGSAYCPLSPSQEFCWSDYLPFTHPETQRLSTCFDHTAEVQTQVIWTEGGANSDNFECTGPS